MFDEAKVKKNSPSNYQRWLALEQQVKDYQRTRTQTGGSSPSQRVTDPAVTVTIPVVVRVLFNTPDQNISDAQIQSQIAVLNEDYRRLNADRASTPAQFLGLASDVNVEFKLACVDPAGNPTSGIIRVSTTRTGFDIILAADGTVNDIASGIKYVPGAAPWPSDRYLNIWTCNFNDTNNLGYATFPWQQSPVDGIVLAYNATGRTGTLQARFNKGRTATHEVGHWLGLFHIWGDDSGACTGTDEVADTPNQAGSNSGCPGFPIVTCSNQGDMSMNYMDYTDDACMNLFTSGQKDRMRTLFAAGGLRESFISVRIQQQATETCATNPVFSVAANQGAAVTYNWTVTAPLQITSGQGTNQITCSKTGQGTSTISVSANGYCESKSVTVGPPLTPRLNASGPLNPACWNATNVLTFSIATPQPGVRYNTEFIESGSGEVVESIPGSRFSFRVGLLSNGTSYNIVTTAKNACDSTGNIRYSRTMRTQTCSTSGARVAMYPNPATSSVDFTTEEPTSSGPGTTSSPTTPPAPSGFQVSVYDSNGQLRWQSATRTRSLHFDSSRLPRGLYGIVITENGTVSRLNLSLE